MPFRSPTADAGPLCVRDEDAASSPLPWEPGASLSLYPGGKRRDHFPPTRPSADGGPGAGRVSRALSGAAPVPRCQEESQGPLEGSAWQAGPVFTLYVATPGRGAGAASISRGT